MAAWYSHILNIVTGVIDMFSGGAATDWIMEDAQKKYNLSVQEATWVMQVAEQALNQAGDNVATAKQHLSDIMYARLSSAPFSLQRAALDDRLASAKKEVDVAQSAYDTAQEQAQAARKKVNDLSAQAPSKLATIDAYMKDHI